VLVILCSVLPALGQEHPLKIATANPFQIYTSLKETRDYNESLKAQGDRLQAEGSQKLKEINEKVQQRDANFKPGHPLYDAKSAEIDDLTAKANIWQEVIKRQQAREQKKHFLSMYGRIEAVVAKIAEQEKIDLVISTGPRELPVNVEQMTPEEVYKLADARKIMYANKSVPDLTEKAIAQLDAEYGHK
jgi:Skp family chaperone for outer membrane proteins